VWTKAYLKQKNAKNLKTNKKVFLIPCKEKEKEKRKRKRKIVVKKKKGGGKKKDHK
jgi:hypothetical protein